MSEHSKTPYDPPWVVVLGERGHPVTVKSASGHVVLTARYKGKELHAVLHGGCSIDKLLVAVNSHAQLVEAAQIGLRAAKLLVGLAGDECAFGSASVLWQKHAATIQAALSGTPTVPSREAQLEEALRSMLNNWAEWDDELEPENSPGAIARNKTVRLYAAAKAVLEGAPE